MTIGAEFFRKYVDLLEGAAGAGDTDTYDQRPGVFDDNGVETPNAYQVQLNEHPAEYADTLEEAKQIMHGMVDMAEDGDVIRLSTIYSFDKARDQTIAAAYKSVEGY